MKFYQYGRSMVEMLGVLAIIGVLSVGAIAGYSKAMMKYKLNKQAEAVNLLIANAMQTSSQLSTAAPDSREYHTQILDKLNLLPDGIYYDEAQDSLFDIFGNDFKFFSDSRYGYSWALLFHLQNNSSGFEVCQNMLNIAKVYSTELVRVIREASDVPSQSLWGDKECNEENTPCLRNMSMDDIYSLCNSIQNDRATYNFSFLW